MFNSAESCFSGQIRPRNVFSRRFGAPKKVGFVGGRLWVANMPPLGGICHLLKTFAIFLTDGLVLNEYINWLSNSNEEETGSTICILKRVGDMLEISMDPHMFNAENTYKISIDNFISVIKQWNHFAGKLVQQIIITQNEDEIKVTGKS